MRYGSSAKWLLLALICLTIFFLSCAAEDDDDSSDDDSADDDAGDDDSSDDDDDDDDDLPPGCITGAFEPFFAMFHSHSNFSDGKGTPREAFEYARDEGDLDVFALTDHLEILYIPVPPNKYEVLKSLADELYEPGRYVPLAGFEWSGGIEFGDDNTDIEYTIQGHNNVFFSDELFPWITLDYLEFYQDLLACSDCLSQFNHPGWEGQVNWDGFDYHPEIDPQISLIEMSTWDLDAWPYLFEALDQGWHVSPTWNQDNHNRGWGTEDDHRTGIWLKDLTRESVTDAMWERRTYSTLDRDATLSLMTEDGCWMGSALEGLAETKLLFEADDPGEGDGFAALEIWGPGQEMIDEVDCEGASFCEGEFTLHREQAVYALVRAVQEDGDLIISAPIWLGP